MVGPTACAEVGTGRYPVRFPPLADCCFAAKNREKRCVGVIWGSLWDRFGIVLGSFRDRFGIVLGSFWDHVRDRVGIMLGSV